MLQSDVEYLNIGRRIVPLLGSALGGPSAEALRELAHAYDPSADNFFISAEAVWQQRAGQFDQPFSQDRGQFLDEGSGPAHWQQTIGRFCQNVRAMESPPDLWAGNDGPSYLASHSVTIALDQMLSAFGEIYRLHFQE